MTNPASTIVRILMRIKFKFVKVDNVEDNRVGTIIIDLPKRPQARLRFIRFVIWRFGFGIVVWTKQIGRFRNPVEGKTESAIGTSILDHIGIRPHL